MNGAGTNHDLKDDLDLFGIIDDGLVSSSNDIFEVWPENVDTVLMFLRMGTQWRVSMAGLVGIDYNVLFHFFDLYDIKDRKAMLEDIQHMERTVIIAVNGGNKA